MADHEVELAELAKQHFDNQRFESCLSTVNKLTEVKKSDHKVLHNRAVAQYYLSNLTFTNDFKKTLDQISNQIDKETEDSDTGAVDVDKSVLVYNQVVLFYHLRQYNEALKLLEKLLAVRESLEDVLTYKIAFMCIDIYIKIYSTHKANDIVQLMDRLLFAKNDGLSSRLDEISSSLNQHSNTDSYRPVMHQFRARLALINRKLESANIEITALTALTCSQPALQLDREAETPTDPSVLVTQPDPNLANINSFQSVAAIFLKSNYLYIVGKYRESLRLMSSAPRTPFLTDCGECLPSIFFNNVGCCHALMGKHTLAAFYFRKSLEENDRAFTDFPVTDKYAPLAGRPLSVLGANRHHALLYHLGLQLLFIGKPTQAFEALLESVNVYPYNPRIWLRITEACIANYQLEEQAKIKKQHTMNKTVQSVEGQGLSRKLILGSSQMQQHKVNIYREHTQHRFQRSPQPTLEFGAICVKNALFLLSTQHKHTTTDYASPTLPPTNTAATPLITQHTDSTTTTNNNNNNNNNNSTDINTTTDATEDANIIEAKPGPPLSPEEAEQLSISLLTCGAYISLGLCDPIQCIQYCTLLVQNASITSDIKLLANIYLAEALIINGQIQEAIDRFSPDNIDKSWYSHYAQEDYTPDAILPTNTQDNNNNNNNDTDIENKKPQTIYHKNNYPRNLNQARIISYLNLCSLYCLKKDYEKAKSYLLSIQAIEGESVPTQAILLAVYVELQLGNTNNALQMLKRNQFILLCKNDKKKTKKV